MPPPLGARCALHLEAPAVDLCQRCGSFLCAECVQIRAEDVYCASCSQVLDRPASTRSKVAFGLALAPLPLYLGSSLLPVVGLAGVPIGVLITFTALALSAQETAARRRGASPRKGPWLALAWTFALLDLGILVLVAGVILFTLGRYE